MNEPSDKLSPRPFPAPATVEFDLRQGFPRIHGLSMRKDAKTTKSAKKISGWAFSFVSLPLCDFAPSFAAMCKGSFSLKIVASSMIALSIAGCNDRFGAGGSGETVIPPERFHTVESMELTPTPTTQASTVPTTNPTAENPPPQRLLSLQECRALALKNNLDLHVDFFTPAIAYTSVTQEQAAFEAVFDGNATYQRNTEPRSVASPPFTTENINADAGVGIPLRTGGLIKLDVPLERLISGAALPSQNPNFLTTPNITLNQPLLRGFGYDVAVQGIRLAFYQYQQAEARTKLEVIRVLADTERFYWALYAARQILEVRQKQYDLAVTQFERARREAKAGVIAEVDIVRAESGVADQVEQIILARNNVRLQERNLKHVLNQPGMEMDTRTELIPATKPRDVPLLLNRDRLQHAALTQRMEMLAIELQIIQETLNVRFARNQMLPLLALNYTYGRNGTGQSLGQTYNETWNHTYDSHTVGLQLQIPIGNEAARSQLRRAMLARLQQLASREQQAASVRQDVLNAADNVETDWQRILASRKRVDLAARTLDVETHQFELGLRTSTDVLIAQANLADAQSSEVSSVTDYQVAQVDLAVATGTTLGASGVTFQPVIYGKRGL